MSVPDLETRTKHFFDEFIEAFRSFSGTKIAERYNAPYLAFHSNGRSEVFSSSRDIAEYFQRVVDDYYVKGVRSCSFENFEVVAVGTESAFATVTWKLHAGNGAVLVAWRESYNLWFDAGKLLVFASTDHVG